MKRRSRGLAAAAIGLITLLVVAAPAVAKDRAERPNVIVVMADDQDFRSLSAMPQTRKLIGRQGTRFEQAIVNFPLCCPSRATFLSGQYAHNHGVIWNNAPLGGYSKLDGTQTVPVWLQRAGYRTIHIGKYLNEYGEADPLEIPPGWSDWHGGVDPSTYDYYGYTLNNNGKLRTYGRTPSDYSTDVYARSPSGRFIPPPARTSRSSSAWLRTRRTRWRSRPARESRGRPRCRPRAMPRLCRRFPPPLPELRRGRPLRQADDALGLLPRPVHRGRDRRAHRTTTGAGWDPCWRSTRWSPVWSRSFGEPASTRTR